EAASSHQNTVVSSRVNALSAKTIVVLATETAYAPKKTVELPAAASALAKNTVLAANIDASVVQTTVVLAVGGGGTEKIPSFCPSAAAFHQKALDLLANPHFIPF